MLDTASTGESGGPGRSPLDIAIELTEHAASTSWHGPDPYDGLWPRWPRWVVGGRRRRQLVVQAHARAPLDIRKVYRRRHPRIAKALALFGSAALRVYRSTGHQRGLELALAALETLAADDSSGARAWGYPFDVQTRWSYYPADTPNVVVTAFAATALLDAGRLLDREDFDARAREAARWTLDELWVEGFFGYHPESRVNVHNANLLGASLVHVALGGDSLVNDRVMRAVDRTLARQAPDGSWPYGETSDLNWVDSFHTGFVLLCLMRLRAVDSAVEAAISRGAQFYERFFDTSGRATLWADRRFPEDAHSAGTGLSALAALAMGGHVDRQLVERVAKRTSDIVVREDATVARRYRWGRTAVWYPRWCDAHVALGLADAADVLSGPSGSIGVSAEPFM
ncbi:MAG: hypothetical protein M3P44_04545 [Actinomycetota bacterium]|nr:hypothetical protein [Actinomycetota bacterium]